MEGTSPWRARNTWGLPFASSCPSFPNRLWFDQIWVDHERLQFFEQGGGLGVVDVDADGAGVLRGEGEDALVANRGFMECERGSVGIEDLNGKAFYALAHADVF